MYICIYAPSLCYSSTHTQLPFDYYSLKFCKPKDGVQSYAENLGEFLGGDRIENSPYEVCNSYCLQFPPHPTPHTSIIFV